jgi:hypothetical protein
MQVGYLQEADSPKISFLIIQDGGGRHLGFCSKFGNLGTVCPIALKFRAVLQVDNPHIAAGPEFSFSIIHDGGGRHLGFCFKC